MPCSWHCAYRVPPGHHTFCQFMTCSTQGKYLCEQPLWSSLQKHNLIQARREDGSLSKGNPPQICKDIPCLHLCNSGAILDVPRLFRQEEDPAITTTISASAAPLKSCTFGRDNFGSTARFYEQHDMIRPRRAHSISSMKLDSGGDMTRKEDKGGRVLSTPGRSAHRKDIIYTRPSSKIHLRMNPANRSGGVEEGHEQEQEQEQGNEMQ